MKISVLFEEILPEQSELKELQGISFDSRVWMPIISNHIKLYRNPNPREIDIKGKNIFPEQKIL